MNVSDYLIQSPNPPKMCGISRSQQSQALSSTPPSLILQSCIQQWLRINSCQEPGEKHEQDTALHSQFSDQQEITWELAIWWILQRVNAGALGADGRVREDSPQQGVLDIKMKWWRAGGTRGREKSSPGGRTSVYKAMTWGKRMVPGSKRSPGWQGD